VETALISPLTIEKLNIHVIRHSVMACNTCQIIDVIFSEVSRYRDAVKDLGGISV
jgi:hypothetical protein